MMHQGRLWQMKPRTTKDSHIMHQGRPGQMKSRATKLLHNHVWARFFFYDVPRTPAADEAKGKKADAKPFYCPEWSHDAARTPKADEAKDKKDKTSLQSVALRKLRFYFSANSACAVLSCRFSALGVTVGFTPVSSSRVTIGNFDPSSLRPLIGL